MVSPIQEITSIVYHTNGIDSIKIMIDVDISSYEVRSLFCRFYSSQCKNPKQSPIAFILGEEFGLFAYGTPERIRIPDLLVRSQTLYPAELPALIMGNALLC